MTKKNQIRHSSSSSSFLRSSSSSFLKGAITALLLVSHSCRLANANHFTLSDPQCEDLPITVKSVTAYCGDNGCDFGEDVSVSMDVDFYSIPSTSGDDDQASNTYAILNADFLAPMDVWKGSVSSGQIDYCDKVVATSGNHYCPNDGSYTSSDTFTLPDRPSWVATTWMMTGWAITINVTMTDMSGNLLLSCKTKATLITGTDNPAYAQNALHAPTAAISLAVMVGFLGVVVLALIAMNIIGRLDQREAGTAVNTGLEEPGNSYAKMDERDEILMQRSKSMDGPGITKGTFV